MAEDFFKPFKDVVTAAQKFVDEQKGKWDDIRWQKFVNDLQSKQIQITEDMKQNLGAVTEAMKNVYSSISATEGVGAVLSNITNEIIAFIKKQDGSWDHAAWETFIQSLQKKGIDLSEETKTYIGGILEAAKKIYSNDIPKIS